LDTVLLIMASFGNSWWILSIPLLPKPLSNMSAGQKYLQKIRLPKNIPEASEKNAKTISNVEVLPGTCGNLVAISIKSKNEKIITPLMELRRNPGRRSLVPKIFLPMKSPTCCMSSKGQTEHHIRPQKAVTIISKGSQMPHTIKDVIVFWAHIFGGMPSGTAMPKANQINPK
jgi:hypothetical protein